MERTLLFSRILCCFLEINTHFCCLWRVAMPSWTLNAVICRELWHHECDNYLRLINDIGELLSAVWRRRWGDRNRHPTAQMLPLEFRWVWAQCRDLMMKLAGPGFREKTEVILTSLLRERFRSHTVVHDHENNLTITSCPRSQNKSSD